MMAKTLLGAGRCSPLAVLGTGGLSSLRQASIAALLSLIALVAQVLDTHQPDRAKAPWPCRSPFALPAC